MDEIDVSKYIGKGYKENSRGPDYYDCYSLMLAVEKDIGNELEDCRYNSTSKANRLDAVEKEKAKACYEKIEKPLAGCIVILYYNNVPQHVGVYIGNGKVIHATFDRGVVIDELRTLNVEGFYKVK